ncbi:MAG: biopolymer transporter ExbD [Planctomycetota bacterium]
MKRKSPLVRQSSETDFNNAMTPMIDVVFLLLVFFVWTASFQIVEYVLPSEMSAQMGNDEVQIDDPPPPSDFEDIVVRLRWAADTEQVQWSVNDQTLASLAAVGSKLQELVAVGADVTVILHPDPAVPLGYVIETYDQAKLKGFENVSFAVNPGR